MQNQAIPIKLFQNYGIDPSNNLSAFSENSSPIIQSSITQIPNILDNKNQSHYNPQEVRLQNMINSSTSIKKNSLYESNHNLNNQIKLQQIINNQNDQQQRQILSENEKKQMKRQLKAQKQKLKNRNFVNLISADYRIPQVLVQIQNDLDWIYKNLEHLSVEEIKQWLNSPKQYQIKMKKNKNSKPQSNLKNNKSSVRMLSIKSNQILKQQNNRDSQQQKIFDYEIIRKMKEYQQVMNYSKLDIVDLFLNTFNMEKSIQMSFIEQQELQTNKNQIQPQPQTQTQTKTQKLKGNTFIKNMKSDLYFYSSIQQKQVKITQKYKNNIDKYKDFANIKTLNKNILSHLDFVFYLPSMMKVTLLGVEKVDKKNQSAEVSLKVQIKVNLPGFSNSPSFYQDLIKKNFQLTINNENLAGQGAVRFTFNTENTNKFKQQVLTFYSDPIKYFEATHNWGAYNFQKENVHISKLDDFDGFIIVAQLYGVGVKLKSQDFFSPFELLDLCGFIQIKPIRIPLVDLKHLILISQPQILQLFHKANPDITIKFNLIDLGKVENSSTNFELSPQQFMNHINTTQKILIDGYNSAPNLMLIEFSGSNSIRFQISDSVIQKKCKFSCSPDLNICCFNLSKRWELIQTNRKKQIKLIKQLHRQIDHKKFQDNRILIKKVAIKMKRYQMQLILEFFSPSQYQQTLINDFERELTNLSFLLLKIMSLYQNQGIPIQISFKEIEIIKYQICLIKDIELSLTAIMEYIQDSSFYSDLELLRKTQHNLIQILKINFNNNRMWQEYQKTNGQVDKYARNFSQSEIQYQKVTRNDIKQQQKIIQKFMKKYYEIKIQLNQKEYDYDHWFHNSTARFHFPFYRYPITALLLIYVSVLVLGLINITIFFQGPSLTDRLGNISTLLVAYVGMIAVIQVTIEANRLTLTQFLVYLTMASSLACLFYSLYLNLNYTEATAPPGKQSLGLYICVAILVVDFLYPVIMLIYHKCIAEKKYRSVEKPLFKAHEKMYIIMPGTKRAELYLNYKKDSQQEQVREIQSIPHILTDRLLGCLDKALDENRYQSINEKFKKFKKKVNKEKEKL